MSANLPWFSKNAVTLGAVAALSVGVLAACSSNSSSSSSTPSSSSTASATTAGSGSKAPITIGISLSETGDFSTDGLAFKQGYQLWAKDVNAAGGILGRQVQLTILNDDSSTNQVVTNYNTLISADHVDLTFGPFSSLLTGPASAVAARAGTRSSRGRRRADGLRHPVQRGRPQHLRRVAADRGRDAAVHQLHQVAAGQPAG